MLPLASETQSLDLLERIPEPALNALVTVPQAAQFLDIPDDFVVDLIKLGSISCLRSGDERFIRFADVVEYRKRRELRRERERASPLTKVREMIAASGMLV